MFRTISIAFVVGTALSAAVAAAQPQAAERPVHTVRGTLNIYEEANYNGARHQVSEGRRRWTPIDNPIRSIAVHPGDKWEVCAKPRYEECIVIDRSVPDASAIGIQDQIGSVRPAPAAPQA